MSSNENNGGDTLHLWFKPYGGVMNDADLSFVHNYGRRFYPKAMGELAKNLKRLAAEVMQLCPPGTFEWQMTHMTKRATGRYVIQESLSELGAPEGLNFGIQASTPEERQLFAQCFQQESFGQSIQQVVAYWEDSLQSEPTKWQGIKMANGQDAYPVVRAILGFLKSIKAEVRVHTFEINHTPRGIVLTVCLLSPGVLVYYTRLDWTIV